MRSAAPPDRRAAAAASLAPWVLACALAAGSARAQAANHLTVQGLQDLEFFKTDSGSLLLGKNDGEASGVGRLRLWLAGEFVPGFEGVLVGKIDGGNAADESWMQEEIEQAFLRYVPSAAVPLTIEAGKVVVPIGNFSRRYLSSVNPLIGAPDSYDVSYPEALVVTGKASIFDYCVAGMDRPVVNQNYVPDGDTAWRPALELGVTPTIGLRLAAYVTQGPYLGHAVQPMIAAGESWRAFDERVAGVELEFSRGYFELNGDLAFSMYEVPTKGSPSRGQAWFLEPKYTWTPRFFTALRFERNDYPYIAPIDSNFWIAQNVAFHDVEAGVGWRFTHQLLLKASYRRDHWSVDSSLRSFFPDGYSYGLQLSYSFDVLSWFERSR